MKSRNLRIVPIRYTGPDCENGYDPRNSLASTKANCPDSKWLLYRPMEREQPDFDLLKAELLLNPSMYQSGESAFLLGDLPVTRPNTLRGELAALQLAISQFRPGPLKFQYRIYLRVFLKRFPC